MVAPPAQHFFALESGMEGGRPKREVRSGEVEHASRRCWASHRSFDPKFSCSIGRFLGNLEKSMEQSTSGYRAKFD
jgi:hypothetical protein